MKNIKIAIILVVVYATVMMLHWPIGFTYFTQLSNLFAAFAIILQLIDRQDRSWIYLIKYMATVSVFITGMVFLLILAPFDPHGFIGAYLQDHLASVCMHMIVPVLMVWDFLKNDTPFSLKKGYAVYAMIPFLVYFIFVMIIGRLGLRWYGNMTGPYPFLNYGAPTGWFGWDLSRAGYDSLGIGVAYVIVVMSGIVGLIGWGFGIIKGKFDFRIKSGNPR